MFTGIVEELGTIESIEGSKVRIGATKVLEDVTNGRFDRGEWLLLDRGCLGGATGGKPMSPTKRSPARPWGR